MYKGFAQSEGIFDLTWENPTNTRFEYYITK